MRSVRSVLAEFFLPSLLGIAAVYGAVAAGLRGWFLAYLLLTLIAVLLIAALVLVPACLRVAAVRRYGSPDPLLHNKAWRDRSRDLRRVIAKVVAVLALVLAVLWLIDRAWGDALAGDHGVVVHLPPEETSVALTISEPEPGDCGPRTSVAITHGLPGLQVTVGREEVEPERRSRSRTGYTSQYEVPVTWPRNMSSCYYDIPAIRPAQGEPTVRVYLRAVSSAGESVPPPSFARDRYWGWSCETTVRRDHCDIMAVLDTGIAQVWFAIALLVGGSVAGLTGLLLIRALRTVARGWREDAVALRRLWRDREAADA